MEPQDPTGGAAPRHLRRRRFWHPASSEAFPAHPQAAMEVVESPPDTRPAVTAKISRQKTKRMIALAAVILTCSAITVLLLALVLWP